MSDLEGWENEELISSFPFIICGEEVSIHLFKYRPEMPYLGTFFHESKREIAIAMNIEDATQVSSTIEHELSHAYDYYFWNAHESEEFQADAQPIVSRESKRLTEAIKANMDKKAVVEMEAQTSRAQGVALITRLYGG